MHRTHCLLLPVLIANAIPAQDSYDLKALARDVEAAHRTADAKAVSAFRADLRLQELARDADEHRGELELSVSFLEWQRSDGGNAESPRPWPLIRYKQIDSARAVEQGRDREDYWSVSNGVQQDMQAREMQNDREHCKRNLKLARQMLKFLDPAAVLRSLQEPTAVADEELALGRTDKVACKTVSGTLASFPLRRQGGDDAAVLAKVWVDAGNHRLLALQVTPIGADGKPETENGEFLRFLDHKELAGRLVPMRVAHFAVDDKGLRRQQLGVDITRLELGAELKPEDFDRPK